MSSWNETTEMGGMSLLPVGTRSFEITKARVDVASRGPSQIRELVVGLASTAGSGEATTPLEPFDHSPEGVRFWERIFKTTAAGLGFVPQNGDLPMLDIANEFASWVPGAGLVGRTVEAEVTHHDSKKLKDDGTPFVNHRVKFRGLVGGAPTAAPAPVPSFAGAAAADDDVWG